MLIFEEQLSFLGQSMINGFLSFSTSSVPMQIFNVFEEGEGVLDFINLRSVRGDKETEVTRLCLRFL